MQQTLLVIIIHHLIIAAAQTVECCCCWQVVDTPDYSHLVAVVAVADNTAAVGNILEAVVAVHTLPAVAAVDNNRVRLVVVAVGSIPVAAVVVGNIPAAVVVVDTAEIVPAVAAAVNNMDYSQKPADAAPAAVLAMEVLAVSVPQVAVLADVQQLAVVVAVAVTVWKAASWHSNRWPIWRHSGRDQLTRDRAQTLVPRSNYQSPL
mmetsp:Transcript_31241/g.50226  ORF Transcript_31241/g.50226 Transcript_31241/m.50226 type:complete len:205 (+) Transcript_31241:209-823(+)